MIATQLQLALPIAAADTPAQSDVEATATGLRIAYRLRDGTAVLVAPVPTWAVIRDATYGRGGALRGRGPPAGRWRCPLGWQAPSWDHSWCQVSITSARIPSAPISA